MKRAYDLQSAARKEKTREGDGGRTGCAKKCIRPCVDFLPHCKATPVNPPLRGGFFIGSVRREFFFSFFLWSSPFCDPLADCVRGRELWLPGVTSRRFSHLQAPPKLKGNRWSLRAIQLVRPEMDGTGALDESLRRIYESVFVQNIQNIIAHNYLQNKCNGKPIFIFNYFDLIPDSINSWQNIWQ